MSYYGKNEAKSYSGRGFSLDTVIQSLPIRPAYLRNYKLALKDPVHYFGFIFMKFIEFFTVGASILISIKRK